MYLEMDAHNELLLTKGVCRYLGIVSYHPQCLKDQNGDPIPLSRSTVRLAPYKETVVEIQVESNASLINSPFSSLHVLPDNQQHLCTSITIYLYQRFTICIILLYKL